MDLREIKSLIKADPLNQAFTKKKLDPVYTAEKPAKILIIGQAPGRRAQETGIPWNDASGNNLRGWLGMTKETFYDPKRVALVPMDFYFPGSKVRGDVAPRKEFAPK